MYALRDSYVHIRFEQNIKSWRHKMRRRLLTIIVSVGLVATGFCQRPDRPVTLRIVQLPQPKLSGPMSLEDALAKRRSIRTFSPMGLTYDQLGQLAWAAQGITDSKTGFRTAPSAGAIYPIKLYFATEQGLFVYNPADHTLVQTVDKDIRAELSKAAMGQAAVAQAGCSIIITGSINDVAARYGQKARTYIILEAGHIAQNILLQAVTLELGAVPIGAFDTNPVRRLCHLTSELEPFYIISVGHPAEELLKENEQEQTQKMPETHQLKAVLIIAGSKFRDEELFETKKILEDAKVQTTIASSKTGTIRGMKDGQAKAQILISEIKVEDYNAVVFIGGAGAHEYFDNPVAQNIAKQARAENKILAAICIAPTILANAGLLDGLRATCYASQTGQLKRAGAKFTGADVERDGLIITGSGPQAAEQFGQAIVETLAGR
jgi:protease I